MTHKKRILQMLRHAGSEGVCATQFLRNYMPTYSQRVGELKREGHRIETVDCDFDYHVHNNRMKKYVLTEGGQT